MSGSIFHFVAPFLRLAVVLIGCCYLPAATIFHDRSRPMSLGLFWMYTASGIMVLGVLGICCKVLGIDPRYSAIPCLLVSLYGLRRLGVSCLPRIRFVRPDSALDWVALLASALSFLYILIPGIRMGHGAYPAVFFSVDAPYYLGQIHSLIRYAGWPPPSLSVLGQSFGYHYGSQASCAMLALFSGVAPHIVTFAICMPIIQIAFISGIWRISSGLFPAEHAVQRRWAVPLLLFCSIYPLSALWPEGRPFSLYHSFDILTDPQAFGGGYTILSSQFGMFVAMVCILGLQDFACAASRRWITLIVGIVVIFKSQYSLVLGLGYGMWTLIEALTLRRLFWMWGPLLALLLAIGLYSLEQQAAQFTMTFSLGRFVLNRAARIDTLGLLAIYTLPGVLILLHRRWAANCGNAWRYLLCFCLPGLVFVNLFDLMRGGEFSGAFFEITYVFPIFSAMFTLTLVAENWHALSPTWRRVMVALILLATLPPFAHRVFQTGVLLVAPERAHEYVDNKMLAQALACIPVRDTLLVSNDFHYPAQNNRRDLRQCQFPALFGHQAYDVNFDYEPFSDSGTRLLEQRRFTQDPWDPGLESLARTLGWTHLVIHLTAPHAKVIPLPLLFENSEYRVYEFQPALSRTGNLAAPGKFEPRTRATR